LATASDIINKAVSYIGTKENPPGSNNVVFNTNYYGRPVSGSDYAWCCTFVWDIFRQCGASALFFGGDKTAYCPAYHDWARKNALLVEKSAGKCGDVVLFDFNGNGLADHIGFIERRNDDGTYTTIEGNTSLTSDDDGGAVMRRSRGLSTVLAVARPKYAAGTDAGSYVLKTYKNTSGRELTIYADSKLTSPVGALYSGSSCHCIGEADGCAIVLYKVASAGAYKVGFTGYVKGIL